MLYGKLAFYSKLMILIKHAGGQVFRTIKSLVQGYEFTQAASAMIIVEDARAAPRNLRQCASEYKIPLMSGNRTATFSDSPQLHWKAWIL